MDPLLPAASSLWRGVHCDKQRLWDHLMFHICSHVRTHTHTHIEAQMSAHDSILRDHIDANACPCNCTSSRSALVRLDAVMSTADSICFSSFFFFSLKTWFPYLPKALESSHLSFSASPPPLPAPPTSISSGPSRIGVNYSKEADVTAKQSSDGEEASYVVPPLFFISLPSSSESSNHHSLASSMPDMYKCCISVSVVFKKKKEG